MKIVFLLAYMMVYLIAISPSIYIYYTLYKIYDGESLSSKLRGKMDSCLGILVIYYFCLFVLFVSHYLHTILKVI